MSFHFYHVHCTVCGGAHNITYRPLYVWFNVQFSKTLFISFEAESSNNNNEAFLFLGHITNTKTLEKERKIVPVMKQWHITITVERQVHFIIESHRNLNHCYSYSIDTHLNRVQNTHNTNEPVSIECKTN